MFLIVDNHDPMCVAHLSQILSARSQPFVVRDRTAALEPGEERAFTGVFLSGGDTLDLSQPYDTSQIRLDLQVLAGVPMPIFGICMGFEAIVSAFGGHLITLPSSLPVDPVPITLLSRQWIFMGLPEHVGMLEFNQLGAGYVPPFLEITARSERSPIEAIQHRTRPIVATQFHPEATDQQGHHIPAGLKVVNNFIDLCISVPSGWW